MREHARNVFLYAANLLVPIAVLLTVSLSAAQPGHYGFALVAMAAAYLFAGRLSRRVDLSYRHAWYLPGYAMSVAGPLTAVSDIDAFLATLGAAILLYAASALISRQLVWVYLVVLLVPAWAAIALVRFEVPVRLRRPRGASRSRRSTSSSATPSRSARAGCCAGPWSVTSAATPCPS